MINFLNISRAKYCFLISFIFKVYFVLNQKLIEILLRNLCDQHP